MPLTRGDRAWVCPAGHSFDIARSGYVNLLQPQDRRSTRPGDSRAAVESRAALEAVGMGRALVETIAEKVSSRESPDEPVVVDLGSGTGELLGRVARRRRAVAIGIDLSVAAAGFAARRFPDVTWIVANADRRLPLQDRSVDVVISVHSRRNAADCARVLAPSGALMIALPAPDDLIELREHVQGRRLERERVEAMLHEHRPHFVLAERWPIRERVALDPAGLANLLRSTYRGARFASRERVETLPCMTVTLASELVVLKKL